MFITGGTSSIEWLLLQEITKQGMSARVLDRSRSNLSGLNLAGIDFVYGDVTKNDSVRRGMEGCQPVTQRLRSSAEMYPKKFGGRLIEMEVQSFNKSPWN